jgi:hexosaminidase
MRTIFTALLIFTGILSAGAQTSDSLYLMPRPQSARINNGRFIFTNQFTIGISGPVNPRLTAAVNRFYLQLGKRTGIYFPRNLLPRLIIVLTPNWP